MADSTGRSGEVFDGEGTGFSRPIPELAAGMVSNSMRRLGVDFPLRVIGTNVAGIAGLRLADLFQAELVAQVTGLAASHRAVIGRFADAVAVFAGKAGDVRSFHSRKDVG